MWTDVMWLHLTSYLSYKLLKTREVSNLSSNTVGGFEWVEIYSSTRDGLG